jgi:hypothetical protein
MVLKIVGFILVVLGVIVNFGYKKIIKYILKKEDGATDKLEIGVKSIGMVLAIAGALCVFLGN